MKISLEIGKIAEKKAVAYLQTQGFTLLDTNFYSHFGEIDIIAQKENILHFFEVKYSQKSDPIARISPQKLSKIIKTINYYMYKKNIDMDYQIDAILLDDTSIEIVPNLTW